MLTIAAGVFLGLLVFGLLFDGPRVVYFIDTDEDV